MEESHFNQELQSHYYCYDQTEIEDQPYPLDYSTIAKVQKTDKSLVKGLARGNYQLQSFHRGEKDYKLICHKNKIVVPTKLRKKVMEWYHLILLHPGINRTEETIKQHLWWPQMREDITKHVSCCPICQKNKR